MLDDRFWTKVDKTVPNGCWVWTASKNNKGYGSFRPGGSAPKRLAHRLAFEDANGRIPAGAFVLHGCDNPSCVNPAHLRLGTAKENVQDMDDRDRRVRVSMPGERNGFAKLTDASIITIRRAYIAGQSIEAIAASFGISALSVHDITSGRSWRHVFALPGCPTPEEMKAKAAEKIRNNARINQDIANTIRRRLANGELGKNLAAEYGVHKATISDIKKRKIWID